jgi:hypothetical protein
MDTQTHPFLRALALTAIVFSLWGCGNSGSAKAPISAAQLQANFSAQVTQGNLGGALVVARTLEQRYPQSSEALAVKAQLPAIQARADEQHAQAQAAADQRAHEAQLAADRTARQADAHDRDLFKTVLAKMSQSHDVVEHDTFFQPRANPPSAGPHTYVTLYVGRADTGSVWLRTRLQYGGRDWIFFQSVKFSIDGQTLPEQKLGTFQVQRDNDSDGVWEWVDLMVPDDGLAMFDAMANGKNVVVRFEGKYRHDLELSRAAQSAIRDTLTLYKLMKSGMQP